MEGGEKGWRWRRERRRLSQQQKMEERRGVGWKIKRRGRGDRRGKREIRGMKR